MARPTASEIRIDQLQRATRLRTSVAIGAAAATLAITWLAASTVPGRASSAITTTATQDGSGSTSDGTDSGLQAPLQAPSNFNSGRGGRGGFVANSGGS